MPKVNDFITRQARQAVNTNSPTTLMGARSLLRFNNLPRGLIFAAVIAIVASWVPLAWVVREKFVRSEDPPLHLFQDMDNQPRYNPQAPSGVFENGMAMRPLIPGTVARDRLDADDHFYRGYRLERDGGGQLRPVYFEEYPEQIEMTPEFLARGKELWARYCYLCHGYDGFGNGPIHVRATRQAGQNPNWIPPSSMHDEVRLARPVGHLYNTINNGIRAMAGYGHMIEPYDRWAIVAYIQALQLSQNAPADAVPGELRDRMPVRPASIGGRSLIAAQAEGGTDDDDIPGVPDEAKENVPGEVE